MSEELTKAIETVRAHLVPGSPLTHEANCAAWTLAKAYLSPPAPGPGFDAEAIHHDWLITNGFERSIVIGRYEKPFPGQSWDGYWLTWDDGGAVGISKDSLCVLPVKATTRGELIRLCTALGIPPTPNERDGDR